MKAFVDLLRSLEPHDDPLRKIGLILDWAGQTVSAEGVALLEAAADAIHGFIVKAARGSLLQAAPGIASSWSKQKLPLKPGIIALPPGIAAGMDLVFVHPVNVRGETAWSAMLLSGKEIEKTVRARENEVFIATAMLRECLELERLRGQLKREAEFASLVSVGSRLAVATQIPAAIDLSRTFSSGLDLFTEGLRLPLYVCDMSGRFIYTSPAFLLATEYPSMAAVRDATDFFFEPANRAAEIESLKIAGNVESFPLVVKSGAGKRIEFQDSAVTVGAFVFGVLFDVTGFMTANRELKDTLQVQELLNDSIITATKTLQRTQATSIRALARLAEYRDPETGFHLVRICEFSRLMAEQLRERSPYSFRVSQEYAADIAMSSMLHDIGKVSIPDSILLKPGKLDPAEWDLMKKHTVFGYEVLHKADTELGEQSFLTLASAISLSHHERFDGAGYPEGKKGDSIPLSARICAIADVYDALTTVRPYKQAWSHDRAVAEIQGQSGKQFDPALVEIFTKVNGEFDRTRHAFPG